MASYLNIGKHAVWSNDSSVYETYVNLPIQYVGILSTLSLSLTLILFLNELAQIAVSVVLLKLLYDNAIF